MLLTPFALFQHRPFKCAVFFSTALIILVLALIPNDGIAITLPYQDKLKHIIAFFVLGWLLHRTNITKNHSSTMLFLLCYGLLIEFLQLLLPYRVFSFADIIADFIGIMLFVATVYAIKQFRQRPSIQ